MRKAEDLWNRFWFDSPAPDQMKLLRIAVGSVIFFTALLETPDLAFFYSDRGFMKLAALPQVADMQFRFSLFSVFPGITALWVGQILLLVSLMLMVLGVLPRLMAFVALVLHVSFMHRDVAIVYGADLIATYYLFYLCFADYRPVPPRRDLRRDLGSVAYRFCQLQICVVYAFAGLDKVRGMSWWRGDALWLVLANPQRTVADFTWLGKWPALIAAITYLTLFWELYFPALVWSKPLGRKVALWTGVLIHLGIAVGMGLISFSSIMIASYSVFLSSETVERILGYFGSRSGRSVPVHAPSSK